MYVYIYILTADRWAVRNSDYDNARFGIGTHRATYRHVLLALPKDKRRNETAELTTLTDSLSGEKGNALICSSLTGGRDGGTLTTSRNFRIPRAPEGFIRLTGSGIKYRSARACVSDKNTRVK